MIRKLLSMNLSIPIFNYFMYLIALLGGLVARTPVSNAGRAGSNPTGVPQFLESKLGGQMR